MEARISEHTVSYFTDVFVNRLYAKAQKRHTDSVVPSSLTRQYESVLADYVRGFCTNGKENTIYPRELQELHNDYLNQYQDPLCSFNKYIERFKILFAPPDLHENLVPRLHRPFLFNLLCIFVKEAHQVVLQHLDDIIDKRDTRQVTQWSNNLQLELHHILQSSCDVIKEDILREFSGEENVNPLVDAEVVRLRNGLHLLARQKAQMTARVNELETLLAARDETIRILNEKMSELTTGGGPELVQRPPEEMVPMSSIEQMIQMKVAAAMNAAPPPYDSRDGISNFDTRSHRSDPTPRGELRESYESSRDQARRDSRERRDHHDRPRRDSSESQPRREHRDPPRKEGPPTQEARIAKARSQFVPDSDSEESFASDD